MSRSPVTVGRRLAPPRLADLHDAELHAERYGRDGNGGGRPVGRWRGATRPMSMYMMTLPLRTAPSALRTAPPVLNGSRPSETAARLRPRPPLTDRLSCIWPARYPVHRTAYEAPCDSKHLSCRLSMDTFATGTICFGTQSVIGCNRRPRPPEVSPPARARPQGRAIQTSPCDAARQPIYAPTRPYRHEGRRIRRKALRELRRKRHRLNRYGITNAGGSYTFKTAAHYVNREGMSIQAWRNDEPIHVWPYVARPTVILAMYSLTQVHGAKDANGHSDAGEDPETSGKHGAAQSSPPKILVKSPVYMAAVRYAFDHSASLKFFNRHEDFAHVCDLYAFVYIGPESKRIGQMLHGAGSVTVMSGLELGNGA